MKVNGQWMFPRALQDRIGLGHEGVGRGFWVVGGNGFGSGSDVGRFSREIPDHIVHGVEAAVLWDGTVLRPGDLIPS